MILRRQETGVYKSQPVRFYKIVALTFLFLTIVLLGVVVFMSSKRATITIVTKATPVEINNTVTIGETGGIGTITGTVTTTYITVSQEFQPSGDKEISGTATGEITLHNDSSTSQPLVATTRLLTPEGILFRIKEGVTVPANGTVKAEVYADEAGAGGDVGPVTKFTIPGLNETRQKQVYGSSNVPMTGGVKTVGVLSQKDVDSAKTVLVDKVLEQAKAVLSALYPGKQGVYSVVGNYAIEMENEVGEEVAGFSPSLTARVVGVFYSQQEVKRWADSKLMDRAIDDAELIQPIDSDPVVTLEEYDISQPGEASLNVVYGGTATLNPESKEVQKMLFFGKTKEEVRRYLLSLDHVHGVEVDFRPAWMMTVPHVPDHVNVVVRSVE